MLGLSYAKPLRHMREYLTVLVELLAGRPAKVDGEEYRVNLSLQVPGAKPVPVLVAALGEQMLRLCGRLADGTLLWMTGPKTIETHVVPTLFGAAEEAGRPRPRIVASLPIALTDAPEAAREWIAKNFSIYGSLPSYRAMLDREGAAGPADVAIAGDEKALGAALDRLRDLGVTDFSAAIAAVDAETGRRTLDYLARAVAWELGSQGVRAHVVVPGFVETEMTAHVPEYVRRAFVEFCPQRRLATPDDIASVVLFLVSERAAGLNGQILHATGGFREIAV
jgi:alkanesulfonate monooxygenase SsuD/methylene tetrahydromethanopterin reductase-like flavin-dependent oxidoreductase (luciferase family)